MEINLSQLLANYTEKAQTKVGEYAGKTKFWYYLEVALTLFTISFFIILAIRPAVVTILGLVGEINRKEELSQKMDQKINSIIVAQEQYAVVQENWNLVASFLPSDFDLSKAVAQAMGAAYEEDLDLQGASLSDLDFVKQDSGKKNKLSAIEGKKTENLENLDFSLSSRDDLETIETFLSQLKQLRRWTEVDSYRLSKTESRSKEEEKSGIDLTINGYWLFWRDQ